MNDKKQRHNTSPIYREVIQIGNYIHLIIKKDNVSTIFIF
jgi:hypothetical protein